MVIAFSRANPFTISLCLGICNASLADLLTQITVERKTWKSVDWSRTGCFALFGLTYLGGFQYWLQVHCFRAWFPGMERFANQSLQAKLSDFPGLKGTGKQIFFDCFVHLPFMYFPAFYVTRQLVKGDSHSTEDRLAYISQGTFVLDGLGAYGQNFGTDCSRMLQVWLPADVVIFSVPLWLRFPARTLVSFGWTAYLSFHRGSEESRQDKIPS